MVSIRQITLSPTSSHNTKFPVGPQTQKLQEQDLLAQEPSVVLRQTDALRQKPSVMTRPLRGSTEGPRRPPLHNAHAPKLTPDGRVLRVLLAEDDETVRSLTQRYLTHHGMEVVACCDGKAAYQQFLAQPQSFDVLLTDLQMPEMTGQQLAYMLRQKQPTLPILFVSGFSSEPVKLEDFLSGPTIFLPKPYALAHLLNTLQSLLALSSSTTPHVNV